MLKNGQGECVFYRKERNEEEMENEIKLKKYQKFSAKNLKIKTYWKGNYKGYKFCSVQYLHTVDSF